MINALSKITAALLAIALLFVFPTIQTAQRQEDTTFIAAYRDLQQFVDSVRVKGYLTPEMYQEFTEMIDRSFGGYTFEMEHRHKKYHPEYGDPANPNTFLGKYSVQYEAYYTEDITDKLFPEGKTMGLVSTDEERTYKLEAGDTFTVKLTREGDYPAEILQRLLNVSADSKSESPLVYGGMVLNEDY